MRSALVFLLAAGACTVGEPRPLPMSGFDAGGRDAGLDALVDAGSLGCVEGSTLDMPCASDEQCQDGCFCNGTESCGDDGFCKPGSRSCDDGVDCTMDSCDEEMDRCVAMPDDEVCSDGDACNGAEFCDLALGCRAASPLYCNDEDSCTVDSCDPAVGCVFSPRDLDGDGFASGACGGDDCDDDPRFGRDIYPGAPEDCHNRRDDNCDGARDFNDRSCTPDNDDCGTAEIIEGPGTYSGATRSLSDDYALGCKATGYDAVFRFTLAETQDVRVTASGGPGTAVAIRRFSECAAGPDLACNDFSPATVLSRSLPPGDYAIVVKQTTMGVFDLNVRFEPPTVAPPVDRCDGTTLDASAGGTFTGMFLEVEDDYELSCQSQARRDAAYRLVLTEPKDVLINARTTGSGFTSTYVSLVTDCADDATTVQCRSGSSSGAEIRRRELAPGTYYILIESSRSDAASWTMDVSLSDPAPREPGDACSTALDITGGPQTATIQPVAELDAGASCGSSSSFARDLLFTFTLAETRDVDLTVTSPSSFSTAVALATECGVSGTELRCRSGSSSAMQTFRSLPPGTYFVVVQTTLSSGTVTAQIETRPPTPIPPNDICSGAIDISGGYFNRDTLSGFEDDTTTCRTGYPDAFYTFTLSRRSRASITVTPATGFASYVVALRDGCGASRDLECRSGNPAAIATDLDPGTYVLVVEAPAGSAGDFDLAASFFPL